MSRTKVWKTGPGDKKLRQIMALALERIGSTDRTRELLLQIRENGTRMGFLDFYRNAS